MFTSQGALLHGGIVILEIHHSSLQAGVLSCHDTAPMIHPAERSGSDVCLTTSSRRKPSQMRIRLFVGVLAAVSRRPADSNLDGLGGYRIPLRYSM